MDIYLNLRGKWKAVFDLENEYDRIYIGKWTGFLYCQNITNVHVLRLHRIGLPKVSFCYVNSSNLHDCYVGKLTCFFKSKNGSRYTLLKILIGLLFKGWRVV